MRALLCLVVIELVFACSVVTFSNHSRSRISRVLGSQALAQADIPIDTPSPVDTASPMDTSSPALNVVVDSPSPDITPSAEPTPVSSPEESPSAVPSPSTDQNTATNSESSSGSQTNSTTGTDQTNTSSDGTSAGITQTQAVLNPTDLINSPESLNSRSVSGAKQEDDQINGITDPKEQTTTLISFAKDKVNDMANFAKTDDFTSTNFAAQRFDQHINKAIDNLNKVSGVDRTRMESQLADFCSQADPVLRSVELSVPEESEQDIQMARGKCQELNL